MKRFNSVTLYTASGDGYKRTFFERAIVRCENLAQNGFGVKNAEVRIFTSERIKVSVGDWLVIGYSATVAPPYDEAFRVVEAAYNGAGSVRSRHIRLLAKS